jgi:hypothetical protein
MVVLKKMYNPINLRAYVYAYECKGRQLKYICTEGMRKMLSAHGYVGMHMVKIEHTCNMQIGLL